MSEKIGCLYRVDPNGRATNFASGFVVSNGPSFSPDGRTMYHTVSDERTIYAHDLDTESGLVRNPRVFAKFDEKDGWPDGSTVDAEGHLWTTHWGAARITRYAPNGRVDRVIEMPVKNTTSCAFGGEAMDTLFVTTASMEFENGREVYMNDAGFAAAPMAGAIFSVDVGVRGLAEPAFHA